MDKIMSAAKFVLAHYDVILMGLLSIVLAFGAIVEAINLMIPTKNGEPALAKVAKAIAKAAEVLQAIIKFLKVPNKVAPEQGFAQPSQLNKKL